MEIKEERSDDAEIVAEVHRKAFGDHGVVVAALVDNLRGDAKSGEGLYLVAERDGRVVGHVMFSRGLLDASARLVEVQILSPVGVTPAVQGQGIAADLIGRGLELLTARSVHRGVRRGRSALLRQVWIFTRHTSRVPQAIVTYPRRGFQVMTLRAYRPWMTGTLVYPEAFWRHDAVGLREVTSAATDQP